MNAYEKVTRSEMQIDSTDNVTYNIFFHSILKSEETSFQK